MSFMKFTIATSDVMCFLFYFLQFCLSLLQQQKTSQTVTVASVVGGSRTAAGAASCLTMVTRRSAWTGSSPTGTYRTTKNRTMVSTFIYFTTSHKKGVDDVFITQSRQNIFLTVLAVTFPADIIVLIRSI